MDYFKALAGWGVPVSILIVAVGIIVLSLVIEAIGKIIKINMPLFTWLIKPLKNYFASRQAHKALLQNIQETLTALNTGKASDTNCDEPKCVSTTIEDSDKNELKEFLAELRTHYTPENIADRDKWMLDVNTTMHWCREKAKEYDASVQELKQLAEIVKKQSENFDKQQAALELNNKMTSDLYKQGTRTTILDFAHKLANARKADKPVIFSREEFRKINRSYEAYEEFLKTYGGTNGEVDNAMKVIQKAERGELPNIEFLEDIR